MDQSANFRGQGMRKPGACGARLYRPLSAFEQRASKFGIEQDPRPLCADGDFDAAIRSLSADLEAPVARFDWIWSHDVETAAADG